MSLIKINVIGQTINFKKKSGAIIVSGSQEFVQFDFTFDKSWNGLLIFAQFTQNGKSYNQYLADDYTVYLPAEITEGSCSLTLYGSRDKIIATTNTVIFNVAQNQLVSDGQSTEITLSLYEQLVNLVESMEGGSGSGSGSGSGRGKGIEKVEQTTVSKEDGGENVCTVYYTDGSTTEFTFLNGSKGSDGIQGIQGEKGEKGDPGEKGADGAKGDKGDKGDTGEQGIQGIQGIQGEKGENGKTPVKGTDYWTDADKSEIVEDTKNAIDLSSYAEKTDLDSYLPLKGGTCTGGVTAPNFQTGMDESAYFQTKKMRGQGNASVYNHAVDWGYSGHDQVDFYEYGGTWNFYQCQSSAKSAARLIGSILSTGWNGGAVLTGTPTAPTAAEGTNTTQIATTAFVTTAITNALANLGASEVSY